MPLTALITSHLNAPFGGRVSESDLARSLSVGRLAAQTEQANAILSYLFVETDPRLIVSCAIEVGSDVMHVNKLYLSTLEHSAPRSPMWESAVKELL